MKRRNDEIIYIESKKIKVNAKFKCVLPRILMYIIDGVIYYTYN